jgi:hypothetical protein
MKRLKTIFFLVQFRKLTTSVLKTTATDEDEEKEAAASKPISKCNDAL